MRGSKGCTGYWREHILLMDITNHLILLKLVNYQGLFNFCLILADILKGLIENGIILYRNDGYWNSITPLDSLADTGNVYITVENTVLFPADVHINYTGIYHYIYAYMYY